MCGIAGGVWRYGAQGIDSQILRRMTDAIRHRGPDDEGFYESAAQPPQNQSAPGVALGFRRLSIIDLSTGHQPLGNEDDSIQIVFNGEIYNFVELRESLEKNGHRFRTNTDTEAIVHLYEELGTQCFEKLNGMFALGIWDARRQRLVLARDRMGKKPLYYTVFDGQLYFASELKSLLQIPFLEREIDPEAIELYLTYQYIPHPHTIYKSIRKVEPGHCVVFERGEARVEKYWNIDWNLEVSIDFEEAKERVREIFSDAIRLRLRSDVPLGAFLSGGIDSSLVVALAQKQLSQPIRTFSIGFTEADFDETKYAQIVANKVGTIHERFEVAPDALNIIDQLSYQYDEPFSDSSAVPTWYLSQLTRKHVTVALSGDGGDELFSGYERYLALRMSQRINTFLPTKLISHPQLLQYLPDSTAQRSFLRRARRFCEVLGQEPVVRYMNWVQIFGETARRELYNADFAARLPNKDPLDFIRRCWANAGSRDLISQAALGDQQSYIPGALMTKVDIASMAHSLEARQPLLDHRMVEWAATLPTKYKLRGKLGKYLLREAFKDELPPVIWNRPKMGFGVPIAKWFKTSLRERTYEAILGKDARCHEYFRQDALQKLVDQHMSGKVNQCYRLWNILMLELWLRRWRS